MNYSKAFKHFRAKLRNPMWAVSAIADDGSLVISLWQPLFKRGATPRSLVYDDELSRWGGATLGAGLLREHLTLALTGRNVVRAIVAIPRDPKADLYSGNTRGVAEEFLPRDDLVGYVTAFDGNAYRIEFEPQESGFRAPQPQ